MHGVDSREPTPGGIRTSSKLSQSPYSTPKHSIARLSTRSIVATSIFMCTAIVVVAIMRHGFGG